MDNTAPGLAKEAMWLNIYHAIEALEPQIDKSYLMRHEQHIQVARRLSQLIANHHAKHYICPPAYYLRSIVTEPNSLPDMWSVVVEKLHDIVPADSYCSLKESSGRRGGSSRAPTTGSKGP